MKRSNAIAEARDLLSRLGAPLYKALLRSAIQRAEEGDPSDLEPALRSARRVAAKEAADADAAEEHRRAMVAIAAQGRTAEDVATEAQRLRRAQDADYRRWGARRPDERTARKANLCNRLDGRARRLALLADVAALLTKGPKP